jgi:type II secretory pathway component PulF
VPTFPLLSADWPRGLSAEESAELAAGMAELARSGLPLESGLRALAAEMPGRRTGRVLRRLADELSRGVPLEAAIAAQGSSLPAHLRGLIAAGVRSGRLPQVLEEFVSLTQRQRELRRRAALSLAYPVLLLVLIALLAVFLRTAIVPQFFKIFRDFGAKLPQMTVLFFTVIGPVTWTLAIAAGVLAVIPLLCYLPAMGSWLSSLVSIVPLLGPIVRWSRLTRFAQLMAMLLDQQVPLPEALQLTAASLRGTAFGHGCRRAAEAVEAGRPLDVALAASRFPPSMMPLVQWGGRTNNLADAFRASAEVFDARAQSQNFLLEIMAVPLAFITVVTVVGFCILALMLPLVILIQCLSGSGL